MTMSEAVAAYEIESLEMADIKAQHDESEEVGHHVIAVPTYHDSLGDPFLLDGVVVSSEAEAKAACEYAGYEVLVEGGYIEAHGVERARRFIDDSQCEDLDQPRIFVLTIIGS
jgi:hypothetical protein